MSKSRQQKKTKNWSDKQNKDQFVKKARASGFRGRAVYKLEQIDKKYRLINAHSLVADLGSAPGSWSQYLASKVATNEQVVAVDILPMTSIEKINFLQGDFTQDAVVEKLLSMLNNRYLDLVLSDMAPNISGIRSADQARALELQDMICTFCDSALRNGGSLVTKLFEGEAASTARKQFSKRFEQIQMIKPDASRAQSKEMFLLARGYRREQ